MIQIANTCGDICIALNSKDINLNSTLRDKLTDLFDAIKKTCLSVARDEANKAIPVE